MPARRAVAALALVASHGVACASPRDGEPPAAPAVSPATASRDDAPSEAGPPTSSATPSVDASTEAPTTDAGTTAPPLPFASYASLCGAADAGAAAPPSAPASKGAPIRVTFQTTVTSKGAASSMSMPTTEVTASVVAPSLKLRRKVFGLGAGGDPFQCCATAEEAALSFECMFSGVDQIESHGAARREGDELVVRWCTADLSTKRVIDRGEARAPLPPGSTVRYEAPKPRCTPASVP